MYQTRQREELGEQQEPLVQQELLLGLLLGLEQVLVRPLGQQQEQPSSYPMRNRLEQPSHSSSKQERLRHSWSS